MEWLRAAIHVQEECAVSREVGNDEGLERFRSSYRRVRVSRLLQKNNFFFFYTFLSLGKFIKSLGFFSPLEIHVRAFEQWYNNNNNNNNNNNDTNTNNNNR